MKLRLTPHRRLLLALALSLPLPAPLALISAEPPAAAPVPDTLVQRATRIVAALRLKDAAKAARVTDLVARHYLNLGPIHDERDAAIAAAKSADPSARDAIIENARQRALAREAAVGYAFTGALAAELTADQVNAIKDGLTYGVLPNTYKVYLEMLPDLTDVQRARLYAWLYEAREYAINAGSAEEKHAWFGKYKGRINNYLASFDIDMKAAEKAMFGRRKAAGK